MKLGMRILESIKRLQTEQHIKNELARKNAEFMRKSEEYSHIMAGYDKPLRKARLKTEIIGLPFADGEYVAKDRYACDKTNKTAYLAETRYYVTAEALNAVRKDIAKLEAMISPSKLKVDSLPTFKTKLGRVPIYKVGEEPAGCNGVYLTVTPLTPTGKTPRYPVVIHFYNTPMSDDIFHGDISYLANGDIGKADFTYGLSEVTYRASWRSKGGNIAPTVIKAIDTSIQMNPDVVLWRA